MTYSVSFSGGSVDYHFHEPFANLKELVGSRKAVFVTDSNVHALFGSLFDGASLIVIPAGEASKTPDSLLQITEQLIQLEADRSSILIGVGGGMITDLTGFAASVYMRGVRFGFVPTTLLGMVDAAIGGKNGVNVGLHKNMLGTITQPEFVLIDTGFLQTLPELEWSNGFAEVIKYGCIFDRFLFDQLSTSSLSSFSSNLSKTIGVIEACVAWKNKTVQEDQNESGNRKRLNFGHTVGHAIEKLHELPHGHAVSIGMMVASLLSEKQAGLSSEATKMLRQTLSQYQLPTTIAYDADNILHVLKMDKKRSREQVDFILLDAIGRSRIQSLSFDIIRETLIEYRHAGNY